MLSPEKTLLTNGFLGKDVMLSMMPSDANVML